MGNPIVISFELVLNHIILSAKINQKNKIKLVLDTGFPIGGAILFKNEKTGELNLKYIGKTYIGGAGGNPVQADFASDLSLDIGELHLPLQQVIVSPINKDVISLLGVDGIIGYELFEKYLVQIDFENNIINLWNNIDESLGDLGTGLDLELRQNYPFIKCSGTISSSGEVPLDVVIDTGAGHALSLDTTSIDRFSLPENIIECKIGKGAIGDIKGYVGRLSSIKIADYSFSNVVTTFSDGALAKGFVQCNGNLGIELLRRFLVTFDYKNSKIYLEPNSYFGDPFTFNMAGFQFQKSDEGNFIVDYIIKNSPAEEAGLKLNDVITEINGGPANLISANTLDKMIKQESASLKLVVQRESKFPTFNIKLRSII